MQKGLKFGTLPFWKEGQIIIEIDNETDGLYAGSKISGRVLVDSKAPFKCNGLELYLFGGEITCFRKYN